MNLAMIYNDNVILQNLKISSSRFQMMSCNYCIHVHWIIVLFSAAVWYFCDISVRDHAELFWVQIIDLHYCIHSSKNKAHESLLAWATQTGPQVHAYVQDVFVDSLDYIWITSYKSEIDSYSSIFYSNLLLYTSSFLSFVSVCWFSVGFL